MPVYSRTHILKLNIKVELFTWCFSIFVFSKYFSLRTFKISIRYTKSEFFNKDKTDGHFLATFGVGHNDFFSMSAYI